MNFIPLLLGITGQAVFHVTLAVATLIIIVFVRLVAEIIREIFKK